MPFDVLAPMLPSNPSLRNKSPGARNKVAHVELLRGLARPVPRVAIWCEKSLFLIKYRMRYAIYMPSNTKDLAINQTMVAYGNRQNATAFARANEICCDQ